MNKTFSSAQISDLLYKIQLDQFSIEPVTEGVSTEVFKILKDQTTYYLRILPAEESASAQALAHKQMLDLGVKVPGVVLFADSEELLSGRAYMLVDAMPGQSLSNTKTMNKSARAAIMLTAGRQLALINSIKVNGVGWITKKPGDTLEASSNDYDDFALNNLPDKLKSLVDSKILKSTTADKIQSYIANNKILLAIHNHSFLAHGDFGLDHIYQENGEYSGIIDFGDIRGTTKYHDLAHFYTYHPTDFADLLRGYQELFPLPSDYLERIKVEAVLFGVRKLWWVSQNLSTKIRNHATLRLFDHVCI